jgi:hypothetical protein
MKFKILILTFLIGIVAMPANSAGLSSAKAVGMGEAYMGLARGVTAPLYNPANIALSGYRESGIEILGVGAEISNNSFSINDYNKYTGAVLTSSDKEYILGKIPNEGLRLKARVQTRFRLPEHMAKAFHTLHLDFHLVNRCINPVPVN